MLSPTPITASLNRSNASTSDSPRLLIISSRLLTLSTCLRLSPTASLTSPVRQLVRQTRITGEHVTSKKTTAHVSNRASRDGDTPPLRVLSDLLAEGKCSR